MSLSSPQAHVPAVAAPLAAVASFASPSSRRFLLELDLPVDATDAQGCTALLRAAGGGISVSSAGNLVVKAVQAAANVEPPPR